MALGVEGCNRVVEVGCNALFHGFVGGIAAAIVCPPIGFLGGALFGVGIFTAIPLSMGALSTMCVDMEDQRLSEAARTAMVVLSLFAGVAAGWALLMACGFPLSFGAALLIGLAMIPTALLVGCFCPCMVPK